jgi:hypothetical protein
MIDRLKKEPASKKTGERQPYRMTLPGFTTGKKIGLGDVIKHATSAVGIRPCAGCERRADALNGWLVFTGGPPK